MNGEVVGLLADGGCPPDQNGFLVGFLEEEGVQDECKSTHDSCNVFRPSPAKVAGTDESANDRTDEWPDEYHRAKCSDRVAACIITEHIRKSTAHDSQRTRCENAGQKPTQHEGLEVFCGRACELILCEHNFFLTMLEFLP